MSLQSRLDIICDEADGDTVQPDGGSTEANDKTSMETPTSRVFIHLLRCVYSYEDVYYVLFSLVLSYLVSIITEH